MQQFQVVTLHAHLQRWSRKAVLSQSRLLKPWPAATPSDAGLNGAADSFRFSLQCFCGTQGLRWGRPLQMRMLVHTRADAKHLLTRRG